VKEPYTIGPNEVFVFGSNLRGYHGAGAARTALLKYGAVSGCSVGLHGKSYAIPTKDIHLKPLSLDSIATSVKQFLMFAEHHDLLTFKVTDIGCGFAGYTPLQIAPLFLQRSANVLLSDRFMKALDE